MFNKWNKDKIKRDYVMWCGAYCCILSEDETMTILEKLSEPTYYFTHPNE